MNNFDVFDLTKSFGSNMVFHDITLQFSPGVHVLVGLNGCGKTTFFETVLGILKADTGFVLFNEVPLELGNISQFRKIGFMSNSIPLVFELTVLDYLKFLKDVYKISTYDFNAFIEKSSIIFKLNFNFFHSSIKSLSSGNQKLVSFLAATMHYPDVLILDEPFSNVDYYWKNQMMNLINEHRKSQKLIFMSTHEFDLIDFEKDSIYLLKNGSINFLDDKKLTLEKLILYFN